MIDSVLNSAVYLAQKKQAAVNRRSFLRAAIYVREGRAEAMKITAVAQLLFCFVVGEGIAYFTYPEVVHMLSAV